VVIATVSEVLLKSPSLKPIPATIVLSTFDQASKVKVYVSSAIISSF